jgi:hypothetical protein
MQANETIYAVCKRVAPKPYTVLISTSVLYKWWSPYIRENAFFVGMSVRCWFLANKRSKADGAVHCETNHREADGVITKREVFDCTASISRCVHGHPRLLKACTTVKDGAHTTLRTERAARITLRQAPSSRTLQSLRDVVNSSNLASLRISSSRSTKLYVSSHRRLCRERHLSPRRIVVVPVREYRLALAMSASRMRAVFRLIEGAERLIVTTGLLSSGE